MRQSHIEEARSSENEYNSVSSEDGGKTLYRFKIRMAERDSYMERNLMYNPFSLL